MKALDRINKFIFNRNDDEGGKVFLRLKTTAKGIKVKKVESNYVLELMTLVPKRMMTTIPVIWIEDFNFEKSVHADALEIGHEKDKSGEASKATIACVEERWGERLSIRTPDKHATYYYLSPSEKKYAVKIGPIFKSIDDRELEIDWANLQWGVIDTPKETQ